MEVPLQDAVLGTSVKITTFDGDQDIKIKPGSQSGDVISLKAKGIKHLRHNGRGDLHVHLKVLTPTRVDSKEKELFKKLSELRKSEKPALAKRSQSAFGRGRRR